MQTFLLSLITLYQKILSPYWPSQCRYTPSCSEYTRQAILEYGVWFGSWIGIKRVVRCNPFGNHGYDPVPDRGSRSNHFHL
ncbi:MAG: membrane protein insertion efficiency factor YidD [Chloroflexi bacterium]|nr:membrane protein insertion efficiency factor YidD [Chloroflexota bacterium]